MSAFACPHCGGEIVIEAPEPRRRSTRAIRLRDAEQITERRARYLKGQLNAYRRRLVR